MPKLSRWAAWRQRHRLRKAARLLKRKAISDLDYALVAADIIARLDKGRSVVVGDPVTGGAEALFTLGVPVAEWETKKDRQYGPLNNVSTTLAARFPAYEGDGDYTDRKTWDFIWGDQCTSLLWRSQMRLHLRYRLIERYDELADQFPER